MWKRHFVILRKLKQDSIILQNTESGTKQLSEKFKKKKSKPGKVTDAYNLNIEEAKRRKLLSVQGYLVLQNKSSSSQGYRKRLCDETISF